MNAILGRVTPFALVLLLATAAHAQQEPAPQPQLAPPPPPAAAQTQPAQQGGPLPALPSQAPQQAAPQPVAPQAPTYVPPPDAQQGAPGTGDEGQEAPPPAAQWTYNYPTGSWVYTQENGWVWVPVGTESENADGVPYTYLYTPAYGWTWYVSPWGWGPYYYGGWVRHPWRPVGWRGGWVAHPSVFVRLGGHAGYARSGVRAGVGVRVGGGGGHVVVRGGGGGGYRGGGGHGGGGHGGHR